MVKDDLGNLNLAPYPIGGDGVSPLLQLVWQPFAYWVARLHRPGPGVGLATCSFVLLTVEYNVIAVKGSLEKTLALDFMFIGDCSM